MYNEAYLRALFDEMQPSYDRVCDLTSFGFNRRWRRQLVERMALQPGNHVGDLMAGGGESWRYLVPVIGTEGQIIAIDFSSAMLDRARQRRHELRTDGISICHENALCSSIDDASLDAVICVYGVKTLSPDQQNQFVFEVRRVLRDGGRVGVVEVSVPEFLPLGWLYMFYMRHIVPLVGKLLLGNPENYRMLGRYMLNFGDCYPLKHRFERAGFEIGYVSLFHGCASALVGSKYENAQGKRHLSPAHANPLTG